MSGYVLHPEAYIDIDELWEFIAQDNLDAADRVREEIYETLQALIPFPIRDTGDLISPPDPCDSRKYEIFSLRMRLMRNPFSSLPSHGSRNPRVLAAILRDRT